MNKLNIALIGYGYWGKNYVKTLESIKNPLSYICDLNLENDGIFQKDYRTALDDPNIDAVIICTPTNTHFEISKNALVAGKHVLVEKPMTATTNESIELGKISESTGKILMVGHTFLYNPAVEYLKKYIDDGGLGENILSMRARRLSLGPIRDTDNVMWDLTPHDISIFLYLTNSFPNKINAIGTKFFNDKIEDVVEMIMQTKNNIFFNVSASWINPLKIRDIAIVGDKKMAIFDDVATNRIGIYDKGVEGYESSNPTDYALTLREGDIHFPKISCESPLTRECKHFIECINENKTPLSDWKNGLNVVKLLELAQQSLDNDGKTIYIND